MVRGVRMPLAVVAFVVKTRVELSVLDVRKLPVLVLFQLRDRLLPLELVGDPILRFLDFAQDHTGLSASPSSVSFDHNIQAVGWFPDLVTRKETVLDWNPEPLRA
jgi:hypothetical protein